MFKHPPPLLLFVTQALNILLGEKPEWKYSLKHFKKSDFLDCLKRFNLEKVKPPMLELLQPYVEDARFNPETVGKQSMAGGCICKFVLAVYNYARKNSGPVMVDINKK